ncbi:MAG: PPC domain-containing protein [Planctomycetes bacterium]|nr:PPC domain-containing protein [Planctomycetota bacterium]
MSAAPLALLVAAIGATSSGARLAAGAPAIVIAALPAPSNPDVDLLLPRGGQRGSEVEVEFRGARLADAADLLFYSPGFELLSLAAPDAARVTARLRLAPDCRLGEHQLRLLTKSGLSRLLTFWVSPFPTVNEAEPNSDFAHPQPIGRNVTLHGTIANEDVDHFVVEMRAGERLSVEVEGQRLGDAPFDPFVAVLDERRFELASCDDSALFKQDPLLSVVVPADGRYIVQLREASFGGSDRCRYQLHVGTFPRPLAVFPAGGRTKTTRAVELRGDAAGPFAMELVLPDPLPPDFALLPEQGGEVAPSFLPFRARGFDGIDEVEPNDDFAHATAAAKGAPLGLDGVIGSAGDVDCWRFTAKKDERLNIRAHARSLRSPLDPVLSIHAADGRALDSSDDTVGLDSYFGFTAPEDGDYLLRVSDQLRGGGPCHVYRLELSAQAPSLGVDVPRFGRDRQARQMVPVAQGNRYALALHANRNQFAGELAFTVANAPPGVTVTALPMARSVDTTLLLFEAAADAALTGALLEVTGDCAEPKVRGRLRQRFDFVLVAPNETSLYDVVSDRLPLAVVEPLPFTLDVVAPKAPLVQGGQVAVKVVATRQPGFDAPITLRLLGLAPGLGAQPTIVLPAGQSEALYVLNAGGETEARLHTLAILGESDAGGGELLASTPLFGIAVAPPFLAIKLDMAAAEQGQRASVVATIETRAPFTGKAKVELRGLPAEATCVEREFAAGETSLVFDVATTAQTPVGKHTTLFCQVVIEQEGEPILHFTGGGGVLRIDPPAPPAAVTAAAPAPAPAAAPAAAPAPPPAAPPAKPLSRLEQLRQKAREQAQGDAKPATGGER